MNTALRAKVIGDHRRRFQAPATRLVRAPGRVNLIGEHVDYNDGFVLPMAINRAVYAALAPRADGRIVAASLEFEGTFDCSLDALHAGSASSGWQKYVHGVLSVLKDEGNPLGGFSIVFASDLPLGAGLSSSAALELAVARAAMDVAGLDWDAKAGALSCQRAEQDYVGVNCGVMDQLASALGQEGRAILLDCRSLDARLLPLPADAQVVVMDTTTRRELASSEYNARRRQCERASKVLGVKSLRDTTPSAVEAATALPALEKKRTRHVTTEIARTLAAASALEGKDLALFGRLMNESHESLRVDYEVSCDELDGIVEAARLAPGCLGARMTGAGFGGSAVALVGSDQVDAFCQAVDERYRKKTGLSAKLHASAAAQGASVEMAH